MNEAKEPFRFFTRQNLTYLTAKRASNVTELLQGIRELPLSSIYYHTHHFLQQFEFLTPEPPNDFAYWITNVLQDEKLGERLASIDLRQFFRIRDIRDRLIEIIEQSLQEGSDGERRVPRGEEFSFMKAQTFVFQTKHVAHNLLEFRDSLKRISSYSIYYHMFESRLRLERDLSDFSVWLKDSLGEGELAANFAKLDPYTQTLESLRRNLIRQVDKRLEVIQ